jgi:restriction endonuclease EcoRV
VLYSKCDEAADERKQYSLEDLSKIPSVIKDFQFFAQPKYRIASSRPGSGNTKNIGSATRVIHLIAGTGPFAELGEAVYDDYWMFYLTRDMADALRVKRPYTNLKEYLEYKKRGIETLKAHEKEIVKMADEEKPMKEEEPD